MPPRLTPRMARAAAAAAVTVVLATGSLSAFAATSIGNDITTGGNLTATGSVGIGTASPSSKLDVRGASASPVGNLFQVSNLNDTARYLTVSPTATTVADLVVTGSCTGCGGGGSTLNQAYLASTSPSEIQLSSSVGALTVTDVASPTGNIFEIQDRSGAPENWTRRFFTVSSTNTVIATPALTATGNMAVDATTLFVNAGLDRVGVGTATPGSTFDVVGQSRFTATVAPVMDVNRITTDSGSGLYTAMKLERQIVGQTPLDGSGVAIYLRSQNLAGTPTWAGVIGSGLSTVTAGSEVGFIGMKASYLGADPGNGSYGLRLIARSSTVDDAIFSGSLGVRAANPMAELDVRDSSSTPVNNVFQVSNLNDSARYLTVSSTATTVSNLVITGSCTGCNIGGTNLNQAYLASVGSPEIAITAGVGALTVADASAATGNIFEITSAGEASRHFMVSGTNTAVNTALTVAGNAAIDTNVLFVNAASNRVGVNTSSPAVDFEVSGQSRFRATASPVIDIYRDTNASGSSLAVGAKLERLMTGQTAQAGSGISLQLRSPNAVGASVLNGTVGGGLSTVTAGSEVGFLGFKAGYQGASTDDAYGLKLVARSASIDDAVFNGNVGIQADVPQSELDVRDSSSSPATSIFQVSNLNDSARYLTVSSTATTVANLVVTGSCIGCDGGGGGATTLNQAYLASTGTPEIAISPSVGALTVANAIGGASAGYMFEVQNRTNSAGDWSQKYFTVSATSVGINSNAPTATLTVQHLSDTTGTALALRVGSSNIFSVDYQGNISGDRTLSVSRSASFAIAADEFWPSPGISITPQATFIQDLILAKTGTTTRFVVGAAGRVGIMTGTPQAELDVRDAAAVPATSIFHVANLNDSVRYLTVSSTSTSIQTDLDLEDGTGSVSADAVTVNAVTGVITDSTDIALMSSRAAITLTNSRIRPTSVVTATMCSTPDADAMLVAAVTPGSGSATVTVRNVGAGAQASDWKLCFRVSN